MGELWREESNEDDRRTLKYICIYIKVKMELYHNRAIIPILDNTDYKGQFMNWLLGSETSKVIKYYRLLPMLLEPFKA